MRDKYRRGQTLLLSGKAKRRGTRWEMVHPRVQVVETEQEAPTGQLLPVYPLTEGLAQRHVRTLVRRALDACVERLEEVFPAAHLDLKRLWPIHAALPQLHFPSNRESLEQARRRFVYQELLILHGYSKRSRRHTARCAPPGTDARSTQIRTAFPSRWSNQAEAETADMGRSHPMNRLLQGDVGSGKTIVAVYAMLLAVAHRSQVVLMAPTEVLARQHVETLERLLAGSHTRLGLLTGAQTGKARQELLAQIASGEIQIVIGTQAVISLDVPFERLGLVVIDEQHKFGVRQRAALRNASVQPHYLVMTATPIPRTVSMTLFGDLDVTTLRDSPPGRQNVHTYFPPADERARWWEFYRKKLTEGRQGYVIVPLVESLQVESPEIEVSEDEGSDIEGDEVDAPAQTASLEATYEALANGELEAFRLGLIHGRMTSGEKQAAMSAFRRGEIQVLVATSVVEVGVDVPNATLMAIESRRALRPGATAPDARPDQPRLAPGYCCLFAGAQTDEAIARLKASSDDERWLPRRKPFFFRAAAAFWGASKHLGLPPPRRRHAPPRRKARQNAPRRPPARRLRSRPGPNQRPPGGLAFRFSKDNHLSFGWEDGGWVWGDSCRAERGVGWPPRRGGTCPRLGEHVGGRGNQGHGHGLVRERGRLGRLGRLLCQSAPSRITR